MALIHCPECGKEISDSVKNCPGCGFNVRKALKRTPENMEKSKKNKKRLFIIIGVVIIVIVAVLVILFLLIIRPRIQEEKALKTAYADACELMESGSYNDAINEFETISAYENSADKIIECHYLFGEQWYENGDFENALAEFEEVKDYKDASDYITECENEITLKERIDKLSKAYSDVSTNSNITLSSDGLSLSVDSDDEYDYLSTADVFIIIEDLGLPESLEDSMISTNSLMGRLEEEYDEYTVSWSYHPNNGLDAIFEVNKP